MRKKQVYSDKRLAVLISDGGTGSNLQAIIDTIESGTLSAQITVVVSDTAKALGLKRAIKHQIPTLIISKKDDLTTLLKGTYHIDYVCLAGWKKIIPDIFIDTFANRILNLHPGLVPDTYDGSVKMPDGTDGLWNRGKFTEVAIQNFFDHHATYAGSTVHLLSHKFDFGPVLERCFEKILPDDTIESLYSRLKKKEHQIYIQALKQVCDSANFQSTSVNNPTLPPLNLRGGEEGLSRVEAEFRNTKKSVLIIGAGGREHALGWKLKQSQFVEKIYFAPGNGGTRDIGENINIKPDDISALLKFAKVKEINLTIVGPEAPLALGIVNTFQKVKLKIFGPTKEAALLETSKVWATQFMTENKIPHPTSAIFDNYPDVLKYVTQRNGDCVVKADGLTMGKGVYVCSRLDQAQDALSKIMREKIYGSAGNRVVIQEKLVGHEVSVMAFCDGKIAVPIITAQDHKRAFDHDKGPNTGGMGAFAPAAVPVATLKKMQRILTLTVERMREKGIPYVGVLYGGFMLVGNEPYVLEFNCRMGDPETQVQLPLLETDLFSIIEACIDAKLTPEMVTFVKDSALCVVLASDGYPGKYEKGKEISGIRNGINVNGITVVHAGTKFTNGKVVTDGGRVLGVIAVGKNRDVAKKKVYDAISDIHFERMQYRKDIG